MPGLHADSDSRKLKKLGNAIAYVVPSIVTQTLPTGVTTTPAFVETVMRRLRAILPQPFQDVLQQRLVWTLMHLQQPLQTMQRVE